MKISQWALIMKDAIFQMPWESYYDMVIFLWKFYNMHWTRYTLPERPEARKVSLFNALRPVAPFTNMV